MQELVDYRDSPHNGAVAQAKPSLRELLSHRPPLLSLFVFFAAYIIGGGIGQNYAIIPGVAVTFWPPAGIFLAALLWNPKVVWPWFALVGYFAEITCNVLWFHNPFPFASAYFCSNLLETLTAAWLIQRFIRRPFRLNSLEEVSAFVGCGAIAAPVLGATCIALIDALIGKHDFLEVWPLIWLGDSSGLLVTTPLAFVAIEIWYEHAKYTRAQMFEAGLLMFVLVALVLLSLQLGGDVPSLYIAMPPLLWAAARFQVKGAAVSLGIITLLLAYFSKQWELAYLDQDSLLHGKIVSLQTFLGISAVSSLIVATLSLQRQEALDSLRSVNADLEARVALRTAKLRDSEERLRLFIEHAPAAIAMFDREMQCLAASDRWKEYYGASADSTFGLDVQSTFQELTGEWRDVYWRALRGEVIRCAAQQVQGPNQSATWVKWEILPWTVSSGSVGGLLIAIEDITQSKQAEIALRESETRFRNMADNISQFAWITDETGHVFWYNKRWHDYTETTPQQMQERGWEDFHHPDHLQRVVEKFYRQIKDGTNWEDTFPLRGGDGKYRWFLSRAAPIRDAEGSVVRWFGTNTDVTEIREIEAELQKARKSAEAASRAKSDFLANMSHEIRSPMTAILGYLDLLTTNNADELEKIETIRRNGNFLLSLINDILDLSKIEVGKLELESIKFSPRELVDDVVKLMNVRAKENQLTLTLEYLTALPREISSDPTRIRQILVNLVGNAIKFTERGSVSVRVGFDQSKSQLCFEVIDTGIGISPEEMKKLFQPFEQADSSIARKFGGSGLGLAISQRLTSLIGGTISVDSKLNEGSRFSLFLPVHDEVHLELEKHSLPNVNEEPPQVASQSGMLDLRVLLVDDRRDVRFLLNYFVRELGCESVLCENGAEAIEAIHSIGVDDRTFDIVLMDMQMPVMDGITAVRELRKQGFAQPIIALTANAMTSDRDACFEAGFTDWLTKPIDKLRLVETLRRYA